ncbi:MAG: sodium:calcium antiporter [Rubrivivax sp.]
MSPVVLSLQFLAGAAVIGYAGYVLSRSAENLARHYGWGHGLVGLVLLGTVTSLPELASGISAVAWVGQPDLAVGDVLGSCVFNLLLLVVVDALHRQRPIYGAASATHLLTAGFGVVMLGFVTLSLLLAAHAPRLFHLGVYSPMMLALYLLAAANVSRYERTVPVPARPDATSAINPPRAWRAFALAALVVAAVGTWLPDVADRLARATGLSHSVVGTLVLAAATSLPELAVTLAALRLRALDLAIGNLLGSNLFNVVVLAVDDAAYLRGPLLVDVSAAHVGTAVTAMTMTGLVLIGLVLRPQRRVLGLTSWVSVGLVAMYVVNVAWVYLGGM